MGRGVEFSAGFYIFWAFAVLVLPLPMLLAAGTAAVFHELCHLLVLRLCGGEAVSLKIGAGGMVMETLPLSPGRELCCALAGPAGSFLLVLVYPLIPLLSFCALVQGCFNLLPLYPLDGGRAIRCAVTVVKNTLQR